MLLHLLEQNRNNFHTDYHSYLSNHLPMALVSLYEMGATSQRLLDYYNFYVPRLEAHIPSMHFINSNNWKQYLGSRQFYGDYREFFKNEVTRLGGLKNVVREFLPVLIEGVMGGAFHPLLTLGYGIEICDLDSGQLVLDGLAYMAYAFKSLGRIDYLKKGTLEVDDIFQQLKDEHPKNSDYSDNRLKFPIKLELFIAKELETLEKYDVLKVDPILEREEEVMNQIADIVIGLYSTTGDFFILHGVTSCFVMKLALKWMSFADRGDAIRYYLRALITTYIVQNQPPIEFVDANGYADALDSISWENLLHDATQSTDEHTIKFVWTCWKENKEHHNSLYTFCAAQRTGKLDGLEPAANWAWIAAGLALGLSIFTSAKVALSR